MSVEEIIKEGKGTIIDVRTIEEFEDGNVTGSINIPMHELMSRIDEVKQLETPLLLCCASGNRSGQVHQYLKQQGFECYNAGGWADVNAMIS